jgi:two-component system chemotaxis sensor kinase CheA
VITSDAGERYRVRGTALGGAGEEAGWSVLLLTHQAAFDAPVDRLSTSLLWLFVIAVLIVVIALTLAGTRLLSPIRRLTAAVGRTGRAAEFRELPVETHDEVGALTRTFNSIFGTLKQYEESLEQKVEERTEQLREAKQEVSDILDNMAQAIFTVGAERKVNQEYSAYCKELLGDKEIASTDALDLLGLADDDPARKSLRFWLDTVVGANELQWALAGGGGPVKELTYTGHPDGEERVLQLEYAPIYGDGVLAKVMIIARDMTTVVRLQEEVIRKEDENRENLERVAELAQLDPELFTKFLGEADEIVERCHDAIAKLRADMNDTGAVDALFRAMHTLKANARIFKMTSVQNVAHDAEDRFQKVRDGDVKLTAEAIDELEASLSLVRQRLDEYDRLGQRVLLGQGGGGREALARADKPLEALEKVAERLRAQALAVDEGAKRDQLEAAIEEAKDLASRVGSLGMSSLAGRVVETLEEIGKDASAGAQAAMRLGEQTADHHAFHRELSRLPDAGAFIEESQPMSQKTADHLANASESAEEGLNRVLGSLHSFKAHARSSGIRTIQDLAHAMEDRLAELRDRGESLDDAEERKAAAKLGRMIALLGDAQQVIENAAPKDERRKKGATVRVPAARVMEVRRQVKELARALDGRLARNEVKQAYDSLDAAVRELTVVPLSDLFDRMTKMVLDLSIEVGKPMHDLVVEGGEIQVDTKLTEKLRDVLTHGLRNAVDHGIEDPKERPNDKPRRATISVLASWEGDDLVVAVSDDGRGIDLERVRATAVERHQLSEDDAARATDAELIELLFTPGFSTARRVTELSGRGVGLDVIRTTMRELKGDATMTSTRGEGTTLTLRIPASYYQEL